MGLRFEPKLTCDICGIEIADINTAKMLEIGQSHLPFYVGPECLYMPIAHLFTEK